MRHFRNLLIAALCVTTLNSAALAVSEPGHVDEAEKLAKVGLFVRLEAKPGKEDDLARFLVAGKAIVDKEPETSTWYAVRLGPTTFAIFDSFPDESGRSAHLAGKVAAALMDKAPDLLATPPNIEKIDILAVKLPATILKK